MARRDPPFLAVGFVEKPHGTRGELYVRPLSDRPDRYFAEGVELRVGNVAGDRPDEAFPPLPVERVRAFKGGLLVKLGTVEGPAAADALRRRYLLVPFEQVEPLGEDELFYHQLVGLTAVTPAGERLGEVVEVYELGEAHLIEVRAGERTHLVPFVRTIVKAIDLEAERIVLEPPEGLLEL